MKKVLVIGSINMDMVMEVEHNPKVGETVLAKSSPNFIAGGKGANQAYTLGKLGADVAMLGAVGEDENGKNLLDSLNSVNVDTSAIKVSDKEKTALAVICVNKDGDNSIVVNSGANDLVTVGYIEENFHYIEQADIIVMQLEIPLDTVKYCVRKAKDLGKYVILDTAPAVENLSDEFLYDVDIIKPNETELKILCPDKNSVEERCEHLYNRGVKNIIATLGEDGAVLFNENGAKKFSANKDIKVIDTTAAGDSFTAAVALNIAKGSSITEAILFATKVAEKVISKKGAQISIPSIEEVV